MEQNKYLIPGVVCVLLLTLVLIGFLSTPRITLASSQALESQKQIAEPKAETKLADAYPHEVTRWRYLILPIAAEHNIDPNLIAALILQESGGNHKAYSSSGAVGLMQIMPKDGIASTFQCGDHPCFINRPSMQELYDPEFNLRYGIRFLAGLINKHGSIREALYRYGPYDIGYRYADTVLSIYQNYR